MGGCPGVIEGGGLGTGDLEADRELYGNVNIGINSVL